MKTVWPTGIHKVKDMIRGVFTAESKGFFPQPLDGKSAFYFGKNGVWRVTENNKKPAKVTGTLAGR
jgi:hypothetical protein